GNHIVRRIDPATGDSTTVAGTGVAGYNAADEFHLAASAALNAPHGVAVSPFDEFSIADTENRRVRVVTTHNQSPTAKITFPTPVVAGVSVEYSGGGSFDPDGTIASYEWFASDRAMGSGATFTHAFMAPGEYQLTLIVTD